MDRKNELIEWKYYEFTSCVHSETTLSISVTLTPTHETPRWAEIVYVMFPYKIILACVSTVQQIYAEVNEAWFLVYLEHKNKKRETVRAFASFFQMIRVIGECPHLYTSWSGVYNYQSKLFKLKWRRELKSSIL